MFMMTSTPTGVLICLLSVHAGDGEKAHRNRSPAVKNTLSRLDWPGREGVALGVQQAKGRQGFLRRSRYELLIRFGLASECLNARRLGVRACGSIKSYCPEMVCATVGASAECMETPGFLHDGKATWCASLPQCHHFNDCDRKNQAPFPTTLDILWFRRSRVPGIFFEKRTQEISRRTRASSRSDAGSPLRYARDNHPGSSADRV